MWYIRIIMRISWTIKKTYEEVVEMAGYIRSLLELSEKDNYIFGHINRAGGLEKQTLSGKICHTKSRGRQRTKYSDSLHNFVMRKNLPTMSSPWEPSTERIGRP